MFLFWDSGFEREQWPWWEMLYGFDLGVPSTSLAPGSAGWRREGMKGRRKRMEEGGGWGCLEAQDRWGCCLPPSRPATLGKRHFSTPAQMLLHCLELQPNGEQALISYCLPLTVDPCDKCSSRCYIAMPKKSTSDGSKKRKGASSTSLV